jgi:hypothetical protein
VLGGGFDLPFPGHAFDLVTSFQVLEHVPDPKVFLGELSRVTRPGGQIVLTTPNAATRLYPGMTPWNRFHVHEYLADELRALLQETFPTVRILGMFGVRELYETEIRRVDAARQRIRRKAEAEARRAAATQQAERRRAAAARQSARPLPIRIARAVLPGALRHWLRSMVRPAGQSGRRPAPTRAAESAPRPAAAPSPDTREMDLETFLRFTVDDLWYTDTDLDRAMDLLAICDVPTRPDRDPVLHSATGPAPHGRPSGPMGM